MHEGVENEADKRMEDVAKWNEDITELEYVKPSENDEQCADP